MGENGSFRFLMDFFSLASNGGNRKAVAVGVAATTA